MSNESRAMAAMDLAEAVDAAAVAAVEHENLDTTANARALDSARSDVAYYLDVYRNARAADAGEVGS
jgi:hypothetical protein